MTKRALRPYSDLLPSESGLRHEALAPLLHPALGPILRQPLRTGVGSAWYGHIPFAFWLVDAMRPRRIVELGTHHGVSYLAFCQAVEEAGLDAQCMAVDTWQGDAQAGYYGDEVFEDLRTFHDPRYGQFSTLRRVSFSAALDEVPDGSVDLLHIDGFHSYDAVSADFFSWLPKLSSRGTVILHDTNEFQPGFGVWRFMQELRSTYPTFEFLHAHGLGLVAVGSDPPEAVAALCRLRDPDLIAMLRDRFATLGAIQERSYQAAQSARAAQVAADLRVAQVQAAAAARTSQADATARIRIAEAEHAAADRIAQLEAAAREETQNALAARDVAMARAAAIEGSLTWRLTGPVRRALNAAPILRRTGRRALRLAWWTASGQLPAQIRKRRQLVPPGRLREARVLVPQVPPGGWPSDPRLDPFLAESTMARAEAVQRQASAPIEAVSTHASPGISVVILTLNRPDLIGPLLRALVAARPILRDHGFALQILVGDTGSDDPEVLALYRDLTGQIDLVEGLRYHFSRNNNQLCFEHARHDHVLFLNNDVVFDDAAASLLAMQAAIAGMPGAAAAGAVLYFGDGVTLQHGGIGFLDDPAWRGLPFHPRAHTAVPPTDFAPCAPALAVTGACLMVTQREFELLGGFEEAYATECQDVDLCLKLRRFGREVLLVGGPRVLHLENATRPKGEEHWGDRSLFLRRWFSFLASEGAIGA